MRRRTILSIALAVGLIGAGTAPALGATTPDPKAPPFVPFTITDHDDFVSGVNTFTATGPLCPSGTFVDDTRVFAGHPDSSGQINLLVRTVYTCDDGSGSFNTLRQVSITLGPDGSLPAPDRSSSLEGPAPSRAWLATVWTTRPAISRPASTDRSQASWCRVRAARRRHEASRQHPP